MKQGTRANRRQKILMTAAGMNYKDYLVLHEDKEVLIVILRGCSDREKARIISKDREVPRW